MDFCKCVLIISAFLFAIAGALVFGIWYAPNANYNSEYITTKCYFVQGRIYEIQCPNTGGICWQSQRAIEAIPPEETEYTVIGIYTTKRLAEASINYTIGLIGECYYSDDYGIQWELLDAQTPLITGLVCTGISLFVCLLLGIAEAVERRANRIYPVEITVQSLPPPYIPTEKDPLFLKHPYVLKVMNEMKEQV